MNEQELETIIASAKHIIGDIDWSEDEDHSLSVEFKADVASTDLAFPLFVKGSYNRFASSLTFAVIRRGIGCIYRLDLGKQHRNPDLTMVGETHKHKWTDAHRDRWAYEPADITGSADEPIEVWQQFCTEFNLTHTGTMTEPPHQQDLFL